jgi:hypothetical protein
MLDVECTSFVFFILFTSHSFHYLVILGQFVLIKIGLLLSHRWHDVLRD